MCDYELFVFYTSELSLFTISIMLHVANMSSRFEVGKYTFRWESSSSSQNMWLRLLKGELLLCFVYCCRMSHTYLMYIYVIHLVIASTFKTQINRWHSGLYCSRGSFSSRVWWQGTNCYTFTQNTRVLLKKKYIYLYLIYFYVFCSWRMCGHVGWHYMLCSWEHTLLKIHLTQKISEKPSP